MNTKKRGTNFSNFEKILLIEIIAQYKNIIENKRTDAVFLKEKGKCWDEISKKFNSETSVFRDSVTLKNCWENLKKRTRKYYAEEKCKLYKTGGGPYETQHDPIMEKVYYIIKPSVKGLNNEFDNNNMENNLQDGTNSDSNDPDCNSDVIPVEELLEESQTLSDSEDSIIKYINTTQDSSSSYSIATNIDRNKCVNIKRNVFNKETPVKQNIARTVDYKSQFQSMTNDCNKNSMFQENNNALEECTVTRANEQLQDITNYDTLPRENRSINRNTSTIIQKEMENSQQNKGENISIVNMLKKKIGKSHKIQKKSVQLGDNHVKTFYKRSIDSTSQKVLEPSTLADSKKELIEFMKMDSEKKHDVEIQILNMQLQREKLHMQLIEKEIAIKDYLLQRLQNTEKLDTTEYLDYDMIN